MIRFYTSTPGPSRDTTSVKLVGQAMLYTVLVTFALGIQGFSANSGPIPDASTELKYPAESTFQQLVITSDPNSRHIEWTVLESQTSLFVVERSGDGAVFRMVGHAEGIRTSEKRYFTYSFTDQYPEVGEIYYRVIGINKDRSVYFSNITVITQ